MVNKNEGQDMQMFDDEQLDYSDDEVIPHDSGDPLGVLSSTYRVVEEGENVWINTGKIDALAHIWAMESEIDRNNNSQAPSLAEYERYHFFDGTDRTVNWILALDAMNFCFWAEKDQPRWQIHYEGETLNGYLAEAASLKRAVEESIPLWDANYLRNMSEAELANIFRGEQTIPLFEQRLRNVREVGKVLYERFDGQFTHVIEQAGGSAPVLALLIAKFFSSFYDVEFYRNQPVRFYKRAQICVADLYSSFDGKSWGAFPDIDQLTAFADYKLPQILRHFGILSYDPALAQRVDNLELIAAGSEEEIEIRAATVWACELLRLRMIQHDHPMTAAAIDLRLWLMSQSVPDMKPYHRTRTQFY
jgi:hypothetical protein